MSEPTIPEDVKPVSSLFSPDKERIDEAIAALTDIFGPVESMSGELFFDRTRYYAREMGWPLYRRFVSFKELAPPDRLPEIKLQANEVEQGHLREGKRRVNIDPGFVSAERLILATGKNYIHRVYLAKGIYADLTLLFQRGGFQKLPWTYPDYADPETIDFFNKVREQYMAQLRVKRMVADGSSGA